MSALSEKDSAPATSQSGHCFLFSADVTKVRKNAKNSSEKAAKWEKNNEQTLTPPKPVRAHLEAVV